MKRPSSRTPSIAAAATLALAAGLAWFWSRHDRKADDRPPAAAIPAAIVPPAVPEPQPSEVGTSATVTPGDSTGLAATAPQEKAPASTPEAETPAGREQTLDAIQDLVVTYEAASVPALARFLSSQDPEIRNAARDGLIQLGERAAIPFLQEAARRAAPEEAQALREAAEFLALPTWTERRAALKTKQAAQ